MFFNTLRGDHSTGLGAVLAGKEKEEPLIWKRALGAPDFLVLPRTKRFLGDMDKYSIVMAHNRAATQAPINDENAHPFNFGHITLTHNGHVTNAYDFVDYQKRTNIGVDSAQVAQAMQLLGEKEVLERVTGAYAFVWHNAQDGTLNFARNANRPLRFCYIKGENTMWWVSEREMLVAALSRNNIQIESAFLSVPEKMWLKFDLKNLREYSTIPFVPRPAGSARTPAGTTAGGKQTWMGGGGIRHNTSTQQTTGTKVDYTLGARRCAVTEKLITDLLATCEKPSREVLQKRIKEYRENSSRPERDKGVRKIETRMASTGFSYDQKVLVEFNQWSAYPNQAGRLGESTGTIVNTNVPVRLLNVSSGDHVRFNSQSATLCTIVNYKPEEKVPLVVEVHPMAPEFSVEWKKRWERPSVNAAAGPPARGSVQAPGNPYGYHRPQLALPGPKTEAPHHTDGASSSPALTYFGPDNNLISEARYRELIKAGCGCCSGDIGNTVEDSKRLVWSHNAPICWTCSNDPKTVAEFNIPTTQKGMMH